jgi:hypothetical protein
LAIVALIALRWCIPAVQGDSAALAASHETFLYSVVRMPRPLWWMFVASQYILAMLPPLLWVWWADRHTLRIRAVAAAVAAWLGLSVATVAIVSLPSLMVGYPIYTVSETTSVFSFLTSAESGAAVEDVLKDTSRSDLTYIALVIRIEGYRLVVSAISVCIAAVLYLVVSFAARVVRRYGGIRIRLRPAAR